MTHSDTKTGKKDASPQDAATETNPKQMQDGVPAEEDVMPKKSTEPDDDLFDNMPI